MPLVYNLVSKSRVFYHSLIDYPGQYIYPNDRENTEYNRICSDNLDISGIKFFIKIFSMCFCGYTAGFSTVYAVLCKGIQTSTTSVHFPFVEPKSNEEFYLNYTLQWIIFFHACFLYIGIEITMNLFEDFARVSPKLIHLDLTKSIKMYERKEISEPQLRVAFKNVVVQSLDYDSYLNLKRTIFGT